MGKEDKNIETSDNIIIPDNFDREYKLSDLIPAANLELLFSQLCKLGVKYIYAAFPDGSNYFSSHDADSDRGVITSLINNFEDDFSSKVQFLDDKTTIISIEHDLEILGYLVMVFDLKNHLKADHMANFSQFVGNIIEDQALYNYKVLLTSGIHSMVVEDSYQQIKKKTELLEKSEKKYRLLAENLEIEVNKKGREIKNAQAKLMQHEKLASIGQLAAGVAHEINNPMGFISSNLITLKGYCEDLGKVLNSSRSLLEQLSKTGEEYPLSVDLKTRVNDLSLIFEESDVDFLLEDIPALLEESIDGADRINKIVSDLKDFAHPGEETPSYADINKCIESTMNIVWNELKYKATVSKLFGKLQPVYCYPRQLNQVVMNLLVNAANAIDKKGEIVITTKQHKDFIEISVSDNGSGIPEDVIHKIYEPFFTTKEVGSGTGLGLNLVYNIVKKHKGTIDVKSKPGQGTTFVIKLPVNSDL